ncbi:hypothetical protein BKK51_12425 [Rodentibacter trehalosifermentans]|uniref:SF3 helicase domain-containing protein n=1 Tax=Rodentibacter trehalosifermentans TaxID=1908263 RepID=A0A1V3ILX8_9PAST|nr:hypothetical protein BKK51_12425 [Rodentibacter trehalosifermentans]
MGKPNLDFIAFNNGVINRKTGEFLPHNKDYFLLSCIDIDYNLKRSETINFNKWLDWVSKKDPIKRKTILAALYMILGNFYQWQLFLEITGEGGSGKSVFNDIALMIAGEKNSASVNLKDLEKISTRTILLNKTFVFAPDQGKIKSDGAVLKGLTGEDMLLFEPKYVESFNAKIKAVFLITDNEPIIFTEHNGGISRRRTLFLFADKVPDNIKDDKLTDKIKLEIPDIIHLLINTFKDNPDEAKRLLEAQRDSKEAMAIKREVDHLLDFASYFETRESCNGLKAGKSGGEATAIYSLYKIYCQALDEQPIKQRNFMKFFKNALKQHHHKEPYKEKTAARITITNVYLKDDWEIVRQQWLS